jgi:hypothetical protein
MQLPPIPPHISAALADADPSNPIARSVADALRAYAVHFDEIVRRNGGFDEPIELPVPRDELEAVALTLFMTELSTSLPSTVVVRIAPDNDNCRLH